MTTPTGDEGAPTQGRAARAGAPAVPDATSDPDGDDQPRDMDVLLDRLTRTLWHLGQVKHQVRLTRDPELGSYPVLRLLAEQPRRVSDLAERLGTDVSTTSRRVSHLAEQGLVRKTPDRTDQRAHVLVITDEGRAMLERQTRSHHEWLAGVLAEWGPDDVDVLARLLGRLADDIRRRGADAVPPDRP